MLFEPQGGEVGAEDFTRKAGISGAMTLTFLKGAEFEIWNTRVDLMKMTVRGHSSVQHHSSQYPPGGILGCLSCVSYGLWFIIQVY